MTLMSIWKLWQTSEDFESNPFLSLSYASAVINIFTTHSVIGTGALATPSGKLCGTATHHHTALSVSSPGPGPHYSKC